MTDRWIALHCSDDARALLDNYPTAFLLLTQIAMRAKWKDCSITKLKAGQAFIGDWKSAGLHSEKAYRHAKEILANCGLAAFRGASKGTVATLMDTRIFSVSDLNRGGQTGEPRGIPRADKGRTRGGQGATNHTETQIDGYTDTKEEEGSLPGFAPTTNPDQPEKPKRPSKGTKARSGTVDELKAFAVELGLPESDGEAMFYHWESNGWMTGKSPIRDWRAGFRTWKINGWVASAKTGKRQDGTSKPKTNHNGINQETFTGNEF